MAEKKVLIVEDELKLATLLQDYLARAGFGTLIMDRGDGVVDRVRKFPPDLILLDLALPGVDGITICREIRSFSDIPIIMITARVEEIDRLLGLELGADDYICKPFSPREVVARVKAVLRRSQGRLPTQRLAVGPLILDEASHSVKVRGRELSLTPSEFQILKTFLGQPGRVFSRTDLYYKLQGFEFEGSERTIDSHIKNLRRKLTARLGEVEVIRTVYGVGYSFHPPAETD